MSKILDMKQTDFHINDNETLKKYGIAPFKVSNPQFFVTNLSTEEIEAADTDIEIQIYHRIDFWGSPCTPGHEETVKIPKSQWKDFLYDISYEKKRAIEETNKNERKECVRKFGEMLFREYGKDKFFELQKELIEIFAAEEFRYLNLDTIIEDSMDTILDETQDVYDMIDTDLSYCDDNNENENEELYDNIRGLLNSSCIAEFYPPYYDLKNMRIWGDTMLDFNGDFEYDYLYKLVNECLLPLKKKNEPKKMMATAIAAKIE